jgi:hypothetical protein
MRGNLDVHGPDFMGHDITWSDPDGEGFTLKIGLTTKPASSLSRQRWTYIFWDTSWSNDSIFFDDDFETSVMQGEDDEIVRSLLGFLSLQDGDTDSEYFDSYTERQLAWRDERAETLSLYAMDEEE